MQPARFGKSPGYAWINLGTDAKRAHAKALHDSAGGFSARHHKTPDTARNEAFGDGGLVFAMVWGLALFALTVSGVALYWRLAGANRAGRTGLRRWFF